MGSDMGISIVGFILGYRKEVFRGACLRGGDPSACRDWFGDGL